MKVVWSPLSLRDVSELLDYVARQDQSTGSKMAAAIDLALASIASQPKIGTRLDRNNGYRFPIKRYGITIFYRVRPRKRVIEVVRVIRGVRIKRLA